jgi:hypothetical protein
LIPLIDILSTKVRRATPDESAELVVFLAADAARTITGGAFLIDAGVPLIRA